MNVNPQTSSAHSRAATQSNRTSECDFARGIDADAPNAETGGPADFLAILLTLFPGTRSQGADTGADGDLVPNPTAPDTDSSDISDDEDETAKALAAATLAAPLLGQALPAELVMPRSPGPSTGTGQCKNPSIETTSLPILAESSVSANESAALSFKPPAGGNAGEPGSSPTPQKVDDSLLNSAPVRSSEAEIKAIADAAKASTLAPTFDLGAAIAAAGDTNELTAFAASNPPTLERDTHSRDAATPLAPNDLSAKPANATDAAPSSHETARPPPSVVAQIHEQFSEHLQHLREHGRVEMRMDLHPPELGRMRLHLTMQDNELHVRMLVDNDGAKRVLDQQLEPLRIRFAEMGVNLGQLDVRRDGGEPPQEQARQAENPAETPLAWRAGNRHIRNGYVRVVNPDALVDVIA